MKSAACDGDLIHIYVQLVAPGPMNSNTGAGQSAWRQK